MGDFLERLVAQAVFVEFVAAHAQADDKVGTDRLAHGGQDFDAEERRRFSRLAAVLIGAGGWCVDSRRSGRSDVGARRRFSMPVEGGASARGVRRRRSRR